MLEEHMGGLATNQSSLLHFDVKYLLQINISQTRSRGRAGFLWYLSNTKCTECLVP